MKLRSLLPALRHARPWRSSTSSIPPPISNAHGIWIRQRVAPPPGKTERPRSQEDLQKEPIGAVVDNSDGIASTEHSFAPPPALSFHEILDIRAWTPKFRLAFGRAFVHISRRSRPLGTNRRPWWALSTDTQAPSSPRSVDWSANKGYLLPYVQISFLCSSRGIPRRSGLLPACRRAWWVPIRASQVPSSPRRLDRSASKHRDAYGPC